MFNCFNMPDNTRTTLVCLNQTCHRAKYWYALGLWTMFSLTLLYVVPLQESVLWVNSRDFFHETIYIHSIHKKKHWDIIYISYALSLAQTYREFWASAYLQISFTLQVCKVKLTHEENQTLPRRLLCSIIVVSVTLKPWKSCYWNMHYFDWTQSLDCKQRENALSHLCGALLPCTYCTDVSVATIFRPVSSIKFVKL